MEYIALCGLGLLILFLIILAYSLCCVAARADSYMLHENGDDSD